MRASLALAIMDWPFLLFIGIGLFVWFFRENVAALLCRGDIQISWGENRHIKLTEISEGIDEELDPLREEIQSLQSQIAALEESIGTDTKSNAPRQPEGLSNEAKADATRRIIAELKNGKYRWRSIEALAKKAAISEQDTLYILRASVSDIVLSTGKSSRQIARHVSR